jgi:hypothetical protein
VSDENTRKDRLDDLASELLHLDSAARRKLVSLVLHHLPRIDELRLCITGGSGSGKSVFARTVAVGFAIPIYDFDKFIVGGYHPHGEEYRTRLADARKKLWISLPNHGGWIVEHVEACNQDMVELLKPSHCILVEPTLDEAMQVSAARSATSGDSPTETASRMKRALESREYARMQFDKLKGHTLLSKKHLVVKRLS